MSEAYLDLQDCLRMVDAVAVGPVRDLGLLASAVARPQASILGADAYPTLALKAAALLHSLAGNHCLVDGNKRLAWLATVVMLDLNHARASLADDAAFELVMAVARGELDVPEIAGRLHVQSEGPGDARPD